MEWRSRIFAHLIYILVALLDFDSRVPTSNRRRSKSIIFRSWERLWFPDSANLPIYTLVYMGMGMSACFAAHWKRHKYMFKAERRTNGTTRPQSPRILCSGFRYIYHLNYIASSSKYQIPYYRSRGRVSRNPRWLIITPYSRNHSESRKFFIDLVGS